MSLLTANNNKDALHQSQIAYSLLRVEYEGALKKIQSLEFSHQTLDIKVVSLEEEITRLKEQLRLMQQQRFGKKTEKQIGEPIVDASQNPLQAVSGYTRRKGNKSCGRSVDTSTLPRHRFYHDLREQDKHCNCGRPFERIGEDVSEQVEVLPLRLYIAEHIRYKYACYGCQTIQMAPKPKAPIPKAMAGGSLLTEIIINKYQYHLPLYRQSKILASYNALIPDNTLGQWVLQAGSDLMSLYNTYWEVALAAGYLQVDETPVKVLKPEKQGYLWTYFAPLIGKGLIIFELSLTRSGSVADERLTNFKGLLQTDGYPGYHNLRKREDISGFGCMAHARRKFTEVLKVTNNPDGIAAEVIRRLQPVYALESKMRDMGLSFHTRKRLRQKNAWPLLKALYFWLKQNVVRIPAKTKLGEAANYMLGQWPYLIRYLRHGSVEIDNNWIENKIRPIAIGRRNWLFMGHEDSGKIHALWYTLVCSALINGLNPRVYIHYLLTRIHDIRKNTVDLKTLLPHTIDHRDLQAFADGQIMLNKQVLDSS